MPITPQSGADLSPSPPPVKLLDRLRHAIRAKHYPLRTEDAYQRPPHLSPL